MIIDSRSMQASAASARQSLVHASTGCNLTICSTLEFNHQPLFRQPQPASAENLAQARQVNALRANGGNRDAAGTA